MPTTTREVVLVTGVSGFVGSHVAAQLLAEGYFVRGTARGDKVAALKAAPVGRNANFEVVEIEDVAVADLGAALEDVKWVIHTASPLAGRASAADGLKSAVRGTLNVLEQAERAGISKIVLTSSWATTMNPSPDKMYQGGVLTRDDWGSVTEEELLSGNNSPLWNYLATKILAEAAAWKFAGEHPSVDLTTINPPFIYGPLHVDFPVPEKTRLGANAMVYALIAGGVLPPQLAPFYCDVRDVALAHVCSLTADNSGSQRKRFLISGGAFTWKAAGEYLATARPELRERLPSAQDAAPLPGPLVTTDVTPAERALGMAEYIPWEQSVCDALDSFLAVEKQWN
ncbi:NAD-P-binding protein [Mycena galericulata]|nr:NAD-P-binding protein [Mycena galericulata]